MWEFVVIILVAGLIGGYAGHLESLFPGTTTPPPPSGGKMSTGSSDLGETPPPQPSLTADLVIGVVASACVPAFIKLTNSGWADALFVDKPSHPNMLFFGGWCLVAAYASRTFLSNFSNKALKQQVAQLQAMVSRLEARMSTAES